MVKYFLKNKSLRNETLANGFCYHPAPRTTAQAVVSQALLEDTKCYGQPPPALPSSPIFLCRDAPYRVIAETGKEMKPSQGPSSRVEDADWPSLPPKEGDGRKEKNIWKQWHFVLDPAHMNDALRQFSALS